MRRSDLVRHQVQRKIERRNRQHRTHRKALHQPPAIFIALGQIERNGFAAKARGFFRRGLEGEHGAIHLGARQAQRLARLGHDELREALLLLDQRGRNVFENLAALPARQRARAAQAGDRVIHGLARIGTCRAP